MADKGWKGIVTSKGVVKDGKAVGGGEGSVSEGGIAVCRRSEQQYKSIRQQAFQNLKVFLPCIRHTELVSQAPSWKLAEQQLNEVHVLSVTKRNVLQLQILQI